MNFAGVADVNDDAVEEERKILVNMVGKICVATDSSIEKLRAVTDLAAEALDAKIATDTTTRNALNKVHQALRNALGEAASVGRSIEDPNADKTGVGHRADVVDASDIEETLLKLEEDKAVKQGQDRLSEELLLDEHENL